MALRLANLLSFWAGLAAASLLDAAEAAGVDFCVVSSSDSSVSR
jgi:hypothetical protein